MILSKFTTNFTDWNQPKMFKKHHQKFFCLLHRMRLMMLLVAFIVGISSFVQADVPADTIHEITIYVMPSLQPINWNSPSELYKSMKNCYLKTVLEKDNYLLGHLVVGLKTPLLPTTNYIAMSAADPGERINLVLKQKIGLGILGATLKGRIETENEIKNKLEVYARRKKLAFITYRISHKGAERIVDFINGFTKKKNEKKAACDYYGGAFWPGYANEGSGCTAFGMNLLRVANIFPAEAEKWLIKVNIPMKIIGGEYNNNQKIENRKITRTKSWYNGNGVANTDYVYHQVYDPSIIYQWILDERDKQNIKYKPIVKNGTPGLYIDNQIFALDNNLPLFEERSNPDLFIQKYLQKNQ